MQCCNFWTSECQTISDFEAFEDSDGAKGLEGGDQGLEDGDGAMGLSVFPVVFIRDSD